MAKTKVPTSDCHGDTHVCSCKELVTRVGTSSSCRAESHDCMCRYSATHCRRTNGDCPCTCYYVGLDCRAVVHRCSCRTRLDRSYPRGTCQTKEHDCTCSGDYGGCMAKDHECSCGLSKSDWREILNDSFECRAKVHTRCVCTDNKLSPECKSKKHVFRERGPGYVTYHYVDHF